ncbi:MAG: hypothetical protein LPJ96_11215 [Exiguobacterium sp.]|uniref:Uncharacterized protein n=1 Tax=Exiguobacterium alkaliphilum TaxID=1428684 RepID=A0ABT2KT47_9BACL|nr:MULTISPECIES: hypothetical protein [Exiguobacterium]MDX5324174.1 hypothetical protein [Exiguobacterium sp.]KDN57283.1 hypothetical protein DI14_01865 [Exiguobacterium sp. AB2]MCT4794137.1 hypothetical protein [Exiguobacterium alkaliphilum]MDX5425999.1 hypothetical protein [Exiguobacterium sp.]MDX6773393.1 hypothetical protein [Exiguobacterium sp.]
MDGLWVLLLAAFGIASAVMKRLEKSSSTTGERPPSSDLKRYLDTVGDMMKEVEGSLEEPKQGQGQGQKLRRRVAAPAAPEQTLGRPYDPDRHAPKSRERQPAVSREFEQTVKIPPITEAESTRPQPQPRMSMKQVRQAVVWSEIIQPPVSKRKR